MNISRSLLLAAIVLLGGCSNNFLYNQLDWLIPWYVDDYVDFTRQQKKDFKARLIPLLRWHRQQELAGYITIIDGIEADLREPVSGAQVEAWANHALAAWERIEARMLPLAFELGGELSDEQMRGFADTLLRNQQSLEDEYLERSDEAYRSDSLENFTDGLADFLGRLTPDQLAVLETAASELQRFDSVWLEERRLWIEQLVELLQREPGWEDAISRAIEVRDRNRGEAYRSAYGHNAGIINSAIAEVLNLRTERQAARLQGEMDDLRDDLRRLVEQAD